MIFGVHRGMLLMDFRQREDDSGGNKRHGHVAGCSSSLRHICDHFDALIAGIYPSVAPNVEAPLSKMLNLC